MERILREKERPPGEKPALVSWDLREPLFRFGLPAHVTDCVPRTLERPARSQSPLEYLRRPRLQEFIFRFAQWGTSQEFITTWISW
jgi:hypothetical protein